MAKENTRKAELTIEYPDYDEYDVSEETIDATITVDGDLWVVDTDGFDGEQTFRVVEERDKIMIAPVGEFGLSTTQTADYEPGSGRVEPQYLKHDDKHVDVIVGEAVDETLGQLVNEARERFVSERAIKSAAELDTELPEIELEVREGQPLSPSSKNGQTVAPRDKLVVEPKSDDSAFDRWQDAIVETCNRYEVYAGNPAKDTDELLAPEGYEAGDTLTLAEYLDAFYTVDPAAVVEAVVPQEEFEAAEKREEKRDELKTNHPELRNVTISNLDAFNEAAEFGERVKVAEHTDSCNDAGKECDLDLIMMYATPAGGIEAERVHTY